MAQMVNVNFRIDSDLKKNVEEISRSMGMSLTTLLTVYCKKIEQERRIPFEIRAEADPYANSGDDPYYSESNLRELKRRYDEIESGAADLEEHTPVCLT